MFTPNELFPNEFEEMIQPHDTKENREIGRSSLFSRCREAERDGQIIADHGEYWKALSGGNFCFILGAVNNPGVKVMVVP